MPSFYRNPASAVMADERDLLDAIQHADLYGDQGWTLDDFKIVSLGEVPLGRIREYEDWGGWIDVDPEDYVGLSVEERLAKLAEFRGPRWAERAAGWLKNGVPPIVVIDAPIVDEHSVHRQIGDGRGRINFALAMGLKRLPVVLMKWKHPLQPAKRTNPASLVTADSLGFKRLGDGFYQSRDGRFQIIRTELRDGDWWYWRDTVKGQGGDDVFLRKREAIEALIDYLMGRIEGITP